MTPPFRIPVHPVLLLAALLPGLLPADRPSTIAPTPWPHEKSDLAPDPEVTWGTFENGVRYASLPNSEPPNRVSLRLYVHAGSLMEKPNQRGLAHFLEHMAFNGTEHFAAGEMVEYFQRLGMAFGSHTNAHTSFRETVYKLELPNAEAAILDEGFKLFRDYADGMLLRAEEIEKERGVILSEKRSRDAPDWRSFVDWIEFALPKSRISKRLPIGTEPVIANASRDRFVDFYESWYTTPRMTLVAVGEIDPAEIRSYMGRYFADLAPPVEPRPDPPLGTIPQRGLVAHHFYDEEASETSVSIETVRPFALGPDDEDRRARELVLRLAHAMISRRLEIVAKEEGAPLIRASAHHRDLFDLNFAGYASLDTTTKPKSWQEALFVLEQELRRALTRGFTEAELAEAGSKLLNQVRNQARSVPTRKSRELADSLVSRLSAGRVFTHPDADLARVEPLLATLTPGQCLDALREFWEAGHHRGIHVTGNVSIPDAETALLAAYRESSSVPVEAPAQAETVDFAYPAPESKGELARRNNIEEPELTQLHFANEVRANLKVTDFEEDTVHVILRFGAGKLSEPEEKPGLSNLFDYAFTNGGLEAHSEDDLKRILAGRTVAVNGRVDDDAFVLSGKTTPDDLLLQLELLRAYLLHPGYRAEAQRQFEKALPPLYNRLNRTPQGVLTDEVARLVHGGDRRFGYPPRDNMAAYRLTDLRSWIHPALTQGYLEISVVGDFPLEAGITALARTFGTLPPRTAEKPAWTEARQVSFPADRSKETFRYPSEIPKAMSLVYWPTTDMSDIERTRRLGMLANILDDRLRVKIREELGEAYSPYARNVSSETYTNFGYLFGMVETAPKQASTIAGIIAKIGSELAADGVTEDELERAKKPMVTMIEEYRRTNRYWRDSVLSRCQEQPERLEWARSFVSDYRSITTGELNELASTYLRKEEALPIVILPEEPEPSPQADGLTN